MTDLATNKVLGLVAWKILMKDPVFLKIIAKFTLAVGAIGILLGVGSTLLVEWILR